MAQVTNSAEGGTSGVTVTTANSGGASGNAFDAVTVTSSGQTCAYDSTHAAHGGLSIQFATGVTAAGTFVRWNTSVGTQTTIWFRLYGYYTANPGSSVRIWNATASGTSCGSVLVTTAGKLLFANSAGTTVLTSTNSIPLNAWFRLEGFLTGNASTGQLEFKLFLSPDAATADETQTSSAAQATTGPPTDYTFLNGGTSVANFGPVWLDDLGLSTTGYLGPVAAAAAAQPARPGKTWLRRFRHRAQYLLASAMQSAVPLADAGSADDTGLAVTAVVPLADAGTSADTLAVTAAVPLADAGTGADSIASGVAISLADAGTGTDSLTVTAAVPLAESGTSAESLAITAAIPLADAGAATDGIAVAAAVPLAEAGSAADSLAVQAATNIAVADAGTGTDSLAITAKTLPLADLAAAADTLAITALITLAETGTAADTLAFAVGGPPSANAASSPAVTAADTSIAAAAGTASGAAVTAGRNSAAGVTDPRDGASQVIPAATSNVTVSDG